MNGWLQVLLVVLGLIFVIPILLGILVLFIWWWLDNTLGRVLDRIWT